MNLPITSMYRGFQIPPFSAQTKPKKVIYGLPKATFYLPRSFVWKGESVADLRDYIDALIERRQLKVSDYEDRNLASDHDYVDPPPEGMVTVSAQLLLSVLRGEFPLELPLGTRVRIRDPEGLGRLVVTDFHAGVTDTSALGLYQQAIIDCVQQGRGLWLEERIKGLKQQENAVTAARQDFNLVLAEEHDTPTVSVEAPPQGPPPVEEAVSTRQVGQDTQVISVVLTQPPYFVRRIFNPEGEVVRLHTAWSAEGPWTSV